MKKVTALLLSLLLLFGMSTTALADEVTIRTTVPERHTVSVQAEGGRIIANNQVCRDSVQIQRQKVQSWWIVPDGGKVLSVLYYNGENVTAQVKAGVFTAPALTDNATLEAVFADAPSAPQDEQYDVSGTVAGPDGKPVPGATVDIGGQTGATDENGNFTVEDVPSGSHTVTVTDQDGNVIGIGEITIGIPESGELSTTTDSNGNPVIVPGSGTAMINLTLTVGEDGVITIGSVKDVTSVQEEPGESDETHTAKPETSYPDNEKPDSADGGSPQTGDNRNSFFWLALLCVSAAALGVIGVKRRQRKPE